MVLKTYDNDSLTENATKQNVPVQRAVTEEWTPTIVSYYLTLTAQICDATVKPS